MLEYINCYADQQIIASENSPDADGEMIELANVINKCEDAALNQF